MTHIELRHLKKSWGDKVLFKEYFNENIASSADVNGKINEKDYESAIQIVHKTKSSSGNIGAKMLYEAASQFLFI